MFFLIYWIFHPWRHLYHLDILRFYFTNMALIWRNLSTWPWSSLIFCFYLRIIDWRQVLYFFWWWPEWTCQGWSRAMYLGIKTFKKYHLCFRINLRSGYLGWEVKFSGHWKCTAKMYGWMVLFQDKTRIKYQIYTPRTNPTDRLKVKISHK